MAAYGGYMRSRLLTMFLLVLIAAFSIAAQTTEFTYQGQLQASAAAANGNFDFEFALFDAPFGGSQAGSTQARNGIAVANGIFAVNLDFGPAFPGANRYLEIRVRQSGGGAFTTLSPRQPINSSPYSVKTLTAESAASATNLTGPLAGDVIGTQSSTTVARLRGTNVASSAPTNGQVLKFNSGTNQWQPDTDNTGAGGGTITGVTAGTGLTGGGTNGTVTVGVANGGVGTAQLADLAVSNAKILDGAVTDAKISSGQVVKSINSLRDNVTLAAGSNISITPSGNTLTIASTGGTVNAILNQTTQQAAANFNISGTGTANAFTAATQYNIGANRILSNAGSSNLFAGERAGESNINGSSNSFFGASAGRATTNSSNSFFGSMAGLSNTSGDSNAFFGTNSGASNLNGIQNAFFGTGAGFASTSGSGNAFFGQIAGAASNGSRNTFIGGAAGRTNSSGSQNTAIGSDSDFGVGNLTNATAIGANAEVQTSNSLVLGSITGVNGATANTRVGIGVAAPNTVLHIRGDGPNGLGTGDLLIEGFGNVGSAISIRSNVSREYSWISTASGASSGAGRLAAFDVTAGAYRMVIDSTGRVGIGTTSPDNLLTVNGTANKPGGGSWATFSDERLKNIEGAFTPGLNALMKLEPIRYKYKPGNPLELEFDTEHIGFSAQAVQKVIPEAVTTTDKGYLLLNNDPILWTMLNAVKEQQGQIAQQQGQIEELRLRVLNSISAAAKQQMKINGQADSLTAERAENLHLRSELANLKAVVCSIRPKAKVCRVTR